MQRIGRVVWVSLMIGVSFGLVIGFGLAVRTGLPLGVPDEWTWARLPAEVPILAWDVGRGLAAVAGYSAFAAIGWVFFRREPHTLARAAWLAGLTVAALVMQTAVLSCAPSGYGLARWVTLEMEGSSGYLDLARRDMTDSRAFLRAYPIWIQRQDALHVGTHPPGLFLTSKAVLDLIEAAPGVSGAIGAAMPRSLRVGMVRILGPMSNDQIAAIAFIGFGTMLACVGTLIPLYALGRGLGLTVASAWTAASLWPVVPSALLFQPTADTAFPLISTTALAFAAHDRRWSCWMAGLTLAVGMLFSLAFLAVGLVAALILASGGNLGSRSHWAVVGRGILTIGAGFCVGVGLWWIVTRANPFAIWWANQANHARFYEEYPRSYARWLVLNPIECAVGLGLPAVVWMVVGLRGGTASRGVWVTLGVLALLTVTGRSLSEVARLWLPLMPVLLTGSSIGMERLDARGWGRGLTIGLVGVQAVWLQTLIQVVYPV